MTKNPPKEPSVRRTKCTSHRPCTAPTAAEKLYCDRYHTFSEMMSTPAAVPTTMSATIIPNVMLTLPAITAISS